MFGKTGVFCDGVMLGMVTQNTLYFRVDEQNRAIFKESEAFPPLNYAKQGSTIDLAFWRVPERLFDEPDEFIVWARAALAAAQRLRRTGGKRYQSQNRSGAPDKDRSAEAWTAHGVITFHRSKWGDHDAHRSPSRQIAIGADRLALRGAWPSL
jgi:DNA transformation protein